MAKCPKKGRSTGEMISTFVFAGMAAKLTFNAMFWPGGWVGGALLWLSALTCTLAAVRFPLQTLADWIRR